MKDEITSRHLQDCDTRGSLRVTSKQFTWEQLIADDTPDSFNLTKHDDNSVLLQHCNHTQTEGAGLKKLRLNSTHPPSPGPAPLDRSLNYDLSRRCFSFGGNIQAVTFVCQWLENANFQWILNTPAPLYLQCFPRGIHFNPNPCTWTFCSEMIIINYVNESLQNVQLF